MATTGLQLSITLSDTLNDERSCHCHFQSMSGLWRLLRQFSCFLYWTEAVSLGLPDTALEQASPWHACLRGTNQPAPRCLALQGGGQSVSCSCMPSALALPRSTGRAMRNVRPGRSMACQNCVFLRSAKVEVGSMPSATDGSVLVPEIAGVSTKYR
jgi:hypothetical protein